MEEEKRNEIIEEESKKPAFEVFNREKTKHYKIYEDGRIEGFGEDMIIINRIATRINYYCSLKSLEPSIHGNTSLLYGAEHD